MDHPPIDRRQFLAGALATGAVGAAHNVLHVRTRTERAPRVALPALSGVGQGILVLVTLYGGNDGLNTVVPYGDPAYYRQRGPIAISESAVLPIGDGFGLHPSLTGVKTLWDANEVAIIRGVGYPDPNYSHFESMDIWQSGNPSGDLPTGWIGRWLDLATRPDPMQALWVGSNVPLAFVGAKQKASTIVANSSPTAQTPQGGAQLLNFYALLQRAHHYDTALQQSSISAGTNMLAVSHVVAKALQEASPVAQNFPATASTFGTQLGVVAQLINTDMPTQVYGVSLNGFDSHAGEDATYTTLLKQLDSGIAGFFKSVQGSPQLNQIVMMIYTEFGRRVISNASGGTDHGSGNTAFIIGSSVKGGFYGDPSSLTQLDSNGSLVVTTDYRSIYATAIEQILGVDSSTILKGQFAPVPFI